LDSRRFADCSFARRPAASAEGRLGTPLACTEGSSERGGRHLVQAKAAAVPRIDYRGAMPLTAWRIGHTVVKCDACGLEVSTDRRPNGYAALLAAGWSENSAAVQPQLWFGDPPTLLLCPACSRDADA
jgi:hypothetical protein